MRRGPDKSRHDAARPLLRTHRTAPPSCDLALQSNSGEASPVKPSHSRELDRPWRADIRGLAPVASTFTSLPTSMTMAIAVWLRKPRFVFTYVPALLVRIHRAPAVSDFPPTGRGQRPPASAARLGTLPAQSIPFGGRCCLCCHEAASYARSTSPAVASAGGILAVSSMTYGPADRAP
jgi:hypothetical protein